MPRPRSARSSWPCSGRTIPARGACGSPSHRRPMTRWAVVREATAGDDRFVVIDNPLGSLAHGLNLGLGASTSDVVAIISGHCLPDGHYLSACVDGLRRTRAGVVGGATRPRAERLLPGAIAVAHRVAFGLGGGAFRDESREGWVDTVYVGAYPRAVIDEIGPWDETLGRNQDIEMNARVRRAGYGVYLSRDVVVQYRPRTTLTGLARQNYGNGYWNVRTLAATGGVLSIRHLVPGFFVAALVVGGMCAIIGALARAPILLEGSILFIGIVLALYILAAVAASISGRRAIRDAIRPRPAAGLRDAPHELRRRRGRRPRSGCPSPSALLDDGGAGSTADRGRLRDHRGAHHAGLDGLPRPARRPGPRDRGQGPSGRHAKGRGGRHRGGLALWRRVPGRHRPAQRSAGGTPCRSPAGAARPWHRRRPDRPEPGPPPRDRGRTGGRRRRGHGTGGRVSLVGSPHARLRLADRRPERGEHARWARRAGWGRVGDRGARDGGHRCGCGPALDRCHGPAAGGGDHRLPALQLAACARLHGRLRQPVPRWCDRMPGAWRSRPRRRQTSPSPPGSWPASRSSMPR